MNGDWLKLHRQIVESPVFANPDLLKMWVWCLCRASYKDNYVPMQTGRGATVVPLEPGQFIFGRHEAAKALKMKPSTVSSRLNKLQTLGNISTQPRTHFTVVTVNNWASYQTPVFGNDGDDWQPTDNQLSTNGQPLGTNKKVKKVKKVKNKRTATKSPSFVPDLEALTWPKHLNTTPARKALASWTEYKQATPHRWTTKQGPQALVNSFDDYSADQFVTQINLALAHGSCKAPWLPSNTFGKTPAQTRPGHIATDHKLQRELDSSGRIHAARKAVRDSKDEATRMTMQQQLDRLLEGASK